MVDVGVIAMLQRVELEITIVKTSSFCGGSGALSMRFSSTSDPFRRIASVHCRDRNRSM